MAFVFAHMMYVMAIATVLIAQKKVLNNAKIISNAARINMSPKLKIIYFLFSFRCPAEDRTFRCDYGGCLHPSLVCNGIKNCNDLSDENPEMCQKNK